MAPGVFTSCNKYVYVFFSLWFTYTVYIYTYMISVYFCCFVSFVGCETLERAEWSYKQFNIIPKVNK